MKNDKKIEYVAIRWFVLIALFLLSCGWYVSYIYQDVKQEMTSKYMQLDLLSNALIMTSKSMIQLENMEDSLTVLIKQIEYENHYKNYSFKDLEKVYQDSKVLLLTDESDNINNEYLSFVYSVIDDVEKNKHYILEKALFDFYSILQGVFLVFGFCFILILWSWISVSKRFKLGLAVLRNRLKDYSSFRFDKADYKTISSSFDDISNLLDNIKELVLEDYYEKTEHNDIFLTCFESVRYPVLIVDLDHKIMFCNNMALDLIKEDLDAIITGLDVDYRDDIFESYLRDSFFVWLQDVEHFVKVGFIKYKIEVSQIIRNGKNYGYQIQFKNMALKAEAEILLQTTKLMSLDSWTTPIRTLREDSDLYDLSIRLENIRKLVNNFFIELNETEIGSFNSIKTLSDLKRYMYHLKSAPVLVQEDLGDLTQVTVVDRQIIEENLNILKDTLLNEFRILVQDIGHRLDDSVLLGYENLIQRVIMIRQDVQTKINALEEVVTCLHEVKTATVSAIVRAHKEGDVGRKSLIVDINHDVDVVVKLLDDLLHDEIRTAELLVSDIDVASKRKMRAEELLTDLEDVFLQHMTPILDKEFSCLDDSNALSK